MVNPGGAPQDSPNAGIAVKRVYEPPEPSDGERILVDRLWPRGLSKERAAISSWRRDLAPSDTLRKWFGHDRSRWPEFLARYRRELSEGGRLEELRAMAGAGRRRRLTLLYAASDPVCNNAVALQYLLAEMDPALRIYGGGGGILSAKEREE